MTSDNLRLYTDPDTTEDLYVAITERERIEALELQIQQEE